MTMHRFLVHARSRSPELAPVLAAYAAAGVMALAECGIAFAAPSSLALDWSRPWVQPNSAAPAATHSDEYAWRLFVAINWPADPVARVADRRASPGGERAVVWETWQNSTDVYREDGADPGPWAKGGPEPAPVSERRFESLSLKDIGNTRHIVHGAMVPLVDPLVQAKRLIEVRMNRVSFDYIRSHELYNVDGQLRAVARGRPVQFPSGAVQVKASWRPIEASQRPRYHTISVRFANGTSRLYGLTALNIAAKELPNWLWASFEHVDNARANGEGWQLASRDSFGCRGAPADCNRAPAGVGLEGTVWENYRLRGTLTAFVDSEQRPQLLANSELEAGLQMSASCITCHARASIGVLDGQPVRLPVFDTTSATGDGSLRRGYVGLPKDDWFKGVDAGRQGAAFRPLDFVWSLSQAKPRHVTGSDNAVDSP